MDADASEMWVYNDNKRGVGAKDKTSTNTRTKYAKNLVHNKYKHDDELWANTKSVITLPDCEVNSPNASMKQRELPCNASAVTIGPSG